MRVALAPGRLSIGGGTEREMMNKLFTLLCLSGPQPVQIIKLHFELIPAASNAHADPRASEPVLQRLCTHVCL